MLGTHPACWTKPSLSLLQGGDGPGHSLLRNASTFPIPNFCSHSFFSSLLSQNLKVEVNFYHQDVTLRHTTIQRGEFPSPSSPTPAIASRRTGGGGCQWWHSTEGRIKTNMMATYVAVRASASVGLTIRSLAKFQSQFEGTKNKSHHRKRQGR